VVYSLRHITQIPGQPAVVLLCGAAYRNVGV